MKRLSFLLVGAVALMSFTACSSSEDDSSGSKGDQGKSEPEEAYLILSDDDILFSSVGDQVSVDVESNYDWTYLCDVDWLKVAKKSNGSLMTVTCTNNFTGAEREGYVTVTAGDGEGNDASATLKVVQTGESIEPLILVYTLNSNSPTLTLPIYDVYSVTIDWDDGEVTTASSDTPSHKYATAGIYEVAIYGAVTVDNYSSSTSRSDLTSIKQLGSGFRPTKVSNLFYECSGLTSVPEVSLCEVFANETDFSYAFYGCSSLTTLPENLFAGCTSATDFSYTFSFCTSLTTLPENLFADCSSATDFSCIFSGCKSLKTLPENLFAGCTSATTFNSAFATSTVNTIPANLFADCSSATDFSYLFCNCTALKTVSEGAFSGCISATDFSYAFYGCTNLATLPEGMFSGCSSVTTFSNAFYRCTSLTTLPENMFAGCSSVTSFYATFCHCTNLKTVSEGLFAGCTSVTSFNATFDQCTLLQSIPTSLFDDCMSVEDFGYTFYYCIELRGESPYTEIDVDGEVVKMHIYDRLTYAAYLRIVVPTYYKHCFTQTKLGGSIPSDWQ